MPRQILLVDDDALMRRSLAFNLERSNFAVQTAASAEDAIAMVRRQKPDLILLDIGLPGMDGLEALRWLRDEMGIPVILLTARRRELDEVLGLELGADDYITKPFDFDVLLARVKAVLRRVQTVKPMPENEQKLISGDLVIDPAGQTVELAGKSLDLSPREFDVLHLLASHAGKVVSTGDLLSQVWGAEFHGQPQVVYVHIRWLREKIERDAMKPERLLTVRGRGYKYMPVEA